MNAQRLKAEKLIYSFFDILDPSGKNTEFWQDRFSKMDDNKFKKYISNPFPFFYQIEVFKEPSIDQIVKSLDLLNVPLLEKVSMPYKYKNKNGEPIKSKPCLVVYIPIKRMKQLLTKKNGMSLHTDTRDMKSGLLTGVDKNGKESDREFESLAISSLDNTIKEFSRPRADAMNDKSALNNSIKTLGQAYLSDLPDDISDSLSKNQLDAYFMGAQLKTNLVSDTYLTPYSMKNRARRTERDTSNI